jgi:DNA-binding HxlR family transcriptional regulator
MASNGFCPVAAAADIVGRKWALLVIHNLLEKPLGFNELKRGMNGVSSKTLSNSLSFLTAEKIVERTVHQNSPIRVEYSLTDKGKEMEGMMEEMRKWGGTWLQPD